MFRFMICDNNKVWLKQLSAELHQQFDPCSVECLYGPDALEVMLREDDGSANILITEIEMGTQNAIDIISKHLKYNSRLQIVYMTSKMDYCLDVYETPHCDFLLKPIQRQRLVQGVKRAMRCLDKKKQACGILVRKGSNIHIIDMSSLIYIQKRARIIRLVTDTEVLEVYNSIEQFLYELDHRFVQCHKSYAVNMDCIKELHKDSFLLLDGTVIPISQSRRKEVRTRYIEYAQKSQSQQ